jgi:hypothetical protein
LNCGKRIAAREAMRQLVDDALPDTQVPKEGQQVGGSEIRVASEGREVIF